MEAVAVREMAVGTQMDNRRSDGETMADRLVALHGSAYQVAVHVLHGFEGAEDAVQQAYLGAMAHLPSELPPEELRAWFLKVVANAAKMHAREESRRKRREATMTREESPRLESDLLDAVRAAVERLDEDHRLPVLLCYEQGLSQAEASEVLGVSHQTLSNRLGAGLESLRKTLAGAGYAAAPATVAGALTQTAPAVPAGLAAAVQGLISGGAASVGKAAAGAALRTSARLGAKKAVGLALGWKVAATVSVLALGAGALVITKPKAKGPVAPPAAVAPGVVYSFDGTSGRGELGTFWKKSQNVRIADEGRAKLLVLESARSGYPAELVSEDIDLGGRPLEIEIREAWEKGIPERAAPDQWSRQIEVDGNADFLALWRSSVISGKPQGHFSLPGAPVVMDNVNHMAMRILVAPSGFVAFSDLGSPLAPGMKRLLAAGRPAHPPRAISLRIWVSSSWGGGVAVAYQKIVVRRLEKWPDDAPPETESLPLPKDVK